MKNLEDYSAKPVCPSSNLTRQHMELGERYFMVTLMRDFSSVKMILNSSELTKNADER